MTRYQRHVFAWACGIAAAANANEGTLPDPVLWYTFNDGTANDVSGSDLDGTLLGDPEPASPGFVGSALRLDGNDGVLAVGSGGLSLNKFAISATVNLAEAPPKRAIIVQKRQVGGAGMAVWINAGSGVPVFAMWDSGGQMVTCPSPYPVHVGVWTTVMATFDGNQMRLFLDGEPAASASAPLMPSSNPGNYMFGQGLVGMIDEVRAYSVALDDACGCNDAVKIWDTNTQSCLNPVTPLSLTLGIGDEIHQHFGMNFVDINRDGWVDIYFANGGTNPPGDLPPTGTCPDPPFTEPWEFKNINACFMNNGDGTFSEDVAELLGIADFENAMRHAFGDYDNDGLLDMISHNFVKSNMYHATAGGPYGVEWHIANDETGVHLCLNRGTGASWADVNNDGFLDFYACEWDPERPLEEHLNKMYLNNQDGTFMDITSAAGVDLLDNPMGMVFGDYDNDGDPDLFLTNTYPAALRLYRNDGVDALGIPQFSDVSEETGVGLMGEFLGEKGIGAGFGDYNNDGLLDLLISREEGSLLFRNEGPDSHGVWFFSDVTNQGGLDFGSGVGSGFLFWGGNFADLDNNGWLDIVMTNRRIPGPNRMFLNNGDDTWREVSGVLGVDMPNQEGLGFCAADFDNDGDLDFGLCSHMPGQPNMVFRNEARGNTWVKFLLTGTTSNRDAVGARIYVRSRLVPGGPVVTQMREVVAGTGFFSDFPREQTFGLGKATLVLDAEVVWPSGQTQDLGALGVNRLHVVTEP